MKRTISRSIILACSTLALASNVPAMAKDFHMDGTFGWLGVGEITALDKGHIFWTGQFSGVYTDKDNKSPLATTSWACPGYNDVGTAAGGYCVITDNAGDALYAKWQNDGKVPVATGHFSFTGGTGKFGGATGQGDFSGIFVAPPHPDGKQSGYTTFPNAVLSLPNN